MSHACLPSTGLQNLTVPFLETSYGQADGDAPLLYAGGLILPNGRTPPPRYEVSSSVYS